MKRSICALIAVLLTLAVLLSGCSLREMILGNLVAYEDMQYARPDMVAFDALLEESCASAQEETRIRKLEKVINEFSDAYSDFYTNLMLASIAHFRDLTDTYWENEYLYCAEQSSVVEAGLDRFFRCLAASPLRQTLEGEDYFGEGYFDAYDGESIYDDHFIELLSEEARLQVDYQAVCAEALEVTYYSEEYFSVYGARMAEIFVELIEVRQQMAAYSGYESYTEFAYDYYYLRDYTPQQAQSYLADVRATLVPLYEQYCREGLAEIELEACDETDMLAYLKSMTQAMGGTISRAYRQMIKGDLYDITYSENKYDSSFETYLSSYSTPYLFICPTGTQYDKLTFAHEFGHFCCDYASYSGSVMDIDVSEIFSQAMEYLSLCYADGGEELTELKMLDSLAVYVEQAAYAAFEHQVYELRGDELTVENVEALYAQTIKNYGMDVDGRDAREYVCIPHFFDSPLYVVSYVLSNDSAMQIYAMELEQAGQGMQTYVDNMASTQPYLLAFLEEAGLESPFADGRLTAVKALFADILA